MSLDDCVKNHPYLSSEDCEAFSACCVSSVDSALNNCHGPLMCECSVRPDHSLADCCMEYYANEIISFGPPSIALYSLLSTVPVISLSKMYRKTLEDNVALGKSFYLGALLTVARSSITYHKTLLGVECGGSTYQMSVYTSLILFFDYNVVSSLILIALKRSGIGGPGKIKSLVLLVTAMSVNPVSVISVLYLSPSLLLCWVNNCLFKEKVLLNHFFLQMAVLVFTYPLFNFLYQSLGYFEEIKENTDCIECRRSGASCHDPYCREYDVISFSLTDLNYKHFTYTKEYVLSELHSSTTLDLLPYLGNLTVEIDVPGISLITLNVLIVVNYLTSLFDNASLETANTSVELKRMDVQMTESPISSTC